MISRVAIKIVFLRTFSITSYSLTMTLHREIECVSANRANPPVQLGERVDYAVIHTKVYLMPVATAQY